MEAQQTRFPSRCSHVAITHPAANTTCQCSVLFGLRLNHWAPVRDCSSAAGTSIAMKRSAE